MPLFVIDKHNLSRVSQTNFQTEKILQNIVEKNLETIFNCRYVAAEFMTGALHAGRIDTLALSEDNNPVIIEYKKVESSDLINQSLFYLSWIYDHRGDFEMAVQKALGSKIAVDWSDVRVICIAPNYRRYDLYAARVMGANLELWTYRLFENSSFYLEEVLQKSDGIETSGKNPVMVAARKKAAITKATGSYTFEQHIQGKSERIHDLALAIHDFVVSLDPSIEVVPKKYYIAYKTAQNIACMEVQTKKILLFLKLDPKKTPLSQGFSRDVSKIGHFGTGDVEITIETPENLEEAKPLIEKSYHSVGG